MWSNQPISQKRPQKPLKQSKISQIKSFSKKHLTTSIINSLLLLPSQQEEKKSQIKLENQQGKQQKRVFFSLDFNRKLTLLNFRLIWQSFERFDQKRNFFHQNKFFCWDLHSFNLWHERKRKRISLDLCPWFGDKQERKIKLHSFSINLERLLFLLIECLKSVAFLIEGNFWSDTLEALSNFLHSVYYLFHFLCLFLSPMPIFSELQKRAKLSSIKLNFAVSRGGADCFKVGFYLSQAPFQSSKSCKRPPP